MAINQHTVSNLDASYWMRHSIPPLVALLKAAGTFTPADQGQHIRFLYDHVIPNLGPRPTKARPDKSLITQSGFPIEFSINMSTGRPKVRYCWEPMGPPSLNDSDIYGISVVHKCLDMFSGELGFSRNWSDALISALAPTPEEAKTAQQNIALWQASLLPPGVPPKPVSRLYFSAIAFELDGPRVGTKLYVSPKVKEIGSGKPMADTVWNLLDELKPAITPSAIEAVQQFLVECPGADSIDMISIDMVEEAQGNRGRFKIYVHSTSNSFNTIRQCLTLSGRLRDKTTLKGLEVLRSIWHLLLQEKEEISDDFEKPVNDPAAMVMKVFFCLELTPGKDLPEVKLHVPIFNYLENDGEALENFEKIFIKCDQKWALNGKYRDMLETAL
ncbi:aromatic prenyl transferase [Nemania abortiva]|nr:aromatic prenyl transferase [Nemania abortiva]